MHVTYGAYAFAPGECNMNYFGYSPIRSARGFVVSSKLSVHLSGELCRTATETDTDFNNRILAVMAAFSVDGQDFALVGSPYQISSADTITGTQITMLDFPVSHNGELANGRAFRIKIEAEIQNAQSLILSYQDSVTQVGNAGPQVEWHLHPYLPPYYTIGARSSVQRIVHEGAADTLSTWLVPPEPFYSPPFELQHLRTIHRISPTRRPQGFEAYRIHWRYEYRLPIDDFILPTAR